MAVLRNRFAVLGVSLLLILLLTGAAMGEGSFVPMYPEASGVKVLSNKVVTVDVSNADKGYVMIRHSGSKKRLMVTTKCGGKEMQFNLNGEGAYEVFPLSLGSGEYEIGVYEHKGTQNPAEFNRIFVDAITVNMPDENSPYLVPNQFVWYTPEYNAVAKSMELCAGLKNDYEKINVLYDFVSSTVIYDYMKALTVVKQRGYLPDPDETLETRTGICFDYAALLACMLRVQGIPTQLVVGKLTANNTVQSHAWNKFCIGGNWSLMDPTLRYQDIKQSDYVEERRY